MVTKEVRRTKLKEYYFTMLLLTTAPLSVMCLKMQNFIKIKTA